MGRRIQRLIFRILGVKSPSEEYLRYFETVELPALRKWAQEMEANRYGKEAKHNPG